MFVILKANPMRGAKLFRSGLISPREPLCCTGKLAASVGVSRAFYPFGTINETELKSKVASSFECSLTVPKIS